MNSKVDRLNIFFVSIIIFFMLANVLIPTIGASISDIQTEGYTQGVSYKPVVPLKKTTFVNYDENSYLDDYAYLASIPTAVFNDGNQLLSSPLLFYQDRIKNYDKKEEILNAYPGIDYFMQDWISFCDYRLDQIIGINVEKDKLKEWDASDYITMEGSDPYNLASQIKYLYRYY